jgi:hypothetical protein
MNEAAQRRARTIAEFQALGAKVFVGDEILRSMASFEPRPSDVVISPFGKCGTTWLQQTFHTLRTRGDTDFDDISDVVPWIETATALGIDLSARQRAEPRGFKSHLPYDPMPKGARYVVSLRDPKDAFISMLRFMEGWFIEPGAVPMADFYTDWASDEFGSNYWLHLLSWWRQRDNPDVLLLTYEHIIDAPEQHIRMLADFCGIALDDDLLALTLERSSLAYMLEHKEKFADPMMRALTERRCGFASGSDSAKVRKGGVGGHKKELEPEIAERIDAAWAEHVEPETGFADYAALDAEIRRRNAV